MKHPETIDMTPSWTDVGNLFYRLAVSKEVRAITAGKSEFLRGFAMAKALNDILPELSPEQRERIHTTIHAELAMRGVQ